MTMLFFSMSSLAERRSGCDASLFIEVSDSDRKAHDIRVEKAEWSRRYNASGQPYFIGGGLVQCSCATASGHAEPSGLKTAQVSASLPASIR